MATVPGYADTGGRRSIAVLRALLFLAFIYGIALAGVAVASSPAGADEARAVVAAVGVVALDGVLLWTAPAIVYRQTCGRRWARAPVFALVGFAILAVSPASTEILVAAAFTPVGVCVLVEDLRGAALCAVAAAAGLGVAALQPHGPSSVGASLSDLIPVLAVMAGGYVPVRLAQMLVGNSPGEVARIRTLAAGAASALSELTALRRESQRERNRKAIEARLAAGDDVRTIVDTTELAWSTVENVARKRERAEAVRARLALDLPDKTIASEFGLTPRQVRSVREAIEEELGVASKAEAVAALIRAARETEVDG
jgi:DNA-binding CsgD family transcriptional regulator